DPSGGAPPVNQGTSPDLDLLLVVDNSIGMATKQQQLAAEIETLIRGLVDPPCVTAGGDIEPPVEGGTCGPNAARQFAPIRSLHVGVISSSLGDLTGGACSSSQLAYPDDQGRLLSRGLDGNVPTENDQGFLAYEQGVDSTPDDLIVKTQDLILGASQLGCGYEMPLEAMLRFLVDPNPYSTLTSSGTSLTKGGSDEIVLQQRAAFLRPTSSLAIVVLSDEDDCSIDVSGPGFLTLRSEPFFKSTAICEVDENDACCTSCALAEENGCPTDGCEDGSQTKYQPFEDHPNLRCWDQKRRYGVDFHYPVQRYVNALSSGAIDPSASDYAPSSDGVQNPLFAGGRDPSQITFLTIGGVPWQDLAVDPSDAKSRYRTADELTASGAWDWITGSQPGDPFMIQHFEERSGTNPANGSEVSGNNDINGGDYPIPDHDRLQYSCLFPLAEPIDQSNMCSDCEAGACENPACDGTTQVYGHAFPGSRQIEVARGLGSRGRVASLCRELDDHTAMDALLVRLANTLE
ncbi:MAG: hypothetical protein JNK04_21100, partial [Myxococcales bacterium]|nr:hypothetical protein [Myxococcales bacterium]